MRDFLDTLLIADEDWQLVPADRGISKLCLICTDIRMADLAAKRRLAREVLALVEK